MASAYYKIYYPSGKIETHGGGKREIRNSIIPLLHRRNLPEGTEIHFHLTESRKVKYLIYCAGQKKYLTDAGGNNITTVEIFGE